jgi:hypothetical protein
MSDSRKQTWDQAKTIKLSSIASGRILFYVLSFVDRVQYMACTNRDGWLGEKRRGDDKSLVGCCPIHKSEAQDINNNKEGVVTRSKRVANVGKKVAGQKMHRRRERWGEETEPLGGKSAKTKPRL